MQSFNDCRSGWSKEPQWENNCGSISQCFLLVGGSTLPSGFCERFCVKFEEMLGGVFFLIFNFPCRKIEITRIAKLKFGNFIP
jgi:hypothetical protein